MLTLTLEHLLDVHALALWHDPSISRPPQLERQNWEKNCRLMCEYIRYHCATLPNKWKCRQERSGRDLWVDWSHRQEDDRCLSQTAVDGFDARCPALSRTTTNYSQSPSTDSQSQRSPTATLRPITEGQLCRPANGCIFSTNIQHVPVKSNNYTAVISKKTVSDDMLDISFNGHNNIPTVVCSFSTETTLKNTHKTPQLYVLKTII